MAEHSDQSIFDQELAKLFQENRQQRRDQKEKFRRSFDTKEITPYERKIQVAHLINGTNFVLDGLAEDLSNAHQATFLANPAYKSLQLHPYDSIQVAKIPYEQCTHAEEVAYITYSAFISHKQRLGEQLVRLNNDRQLKTEWGSLERALITCNDLIDDEIVSNQLPKDALKFWELIQEHPADYFDYIRISRNRDSHTGYVDDPLEAYLYAYYMVPSLRYGLGAGDDNSLQHYFSSPYPKSPKESAV